MNKRTVKVQDLSVTLAAGTGSVDTPIVINGEIIKIVYAKDTISAASTAVLTSKTDSEQIDSYDVNTGSATRYIAVATSVAGSFVRRVVSDFLNVAVAGGDGNHHFSMRIFYLG